jgi:RHS repeat-associated protein
MMGCGVPEPDRGLGDRGDPAPFCGANRQLPMRARSSTGWVAGRPDTTAGSWPIGELGRPASDPPRTASLTDRSPAPVPDAETLALSHSLPYLHRQPRHGLPPLQHNHPRYDAENRLVTAANNQNGSSSYVYNMGGQRVRKTTASGSVDYLYDLAGHSITELSSSGGWNRGEVYAGGKHLATYSGGTNGTTYFNHVDWLGTERARTDKSGNSYETCTSLPFGDWLTCSGGDPSPMHFTGKERDSESNLDNFGARYFTSQMGRFMSPDEPFYSGRLDNPQDLNLYSYVRNNPVTNVDPDGHDVRVCVDNGNGKGGENCVNLTDDQYKQLYNKQNGQQGINLPGGQFPGGNITCNGGQTCGSAQYFEPGLQPDYLGDALIGGIAGGLVNAGRAFFEGLLGSAARDTTAGVIAGEATRAGEATAQDILQGAVKEGGSRADIYAKPGGFAQATKDFDALGGQAQSLGRVQIKDLPNGAGRAVLRNFSSDGRATLEIQPAGGGYKSIAIRYNP